MEPQSPRRIANDVRFHDECQQRRAKKKKKKKKQKNLKFSTLDRMFTTKTLMIGLCSPPSLAILQRAWINRLNKPRLIRLLLSFFFFSAVYTQPGGDLYSVSTANPIDTLGLLLLQRADPIGRWNFARRATSDGTTRRGQRINGRWWRIRL